MRERLIELLNHKYDHFCDQCGVNKDSHYTDNLADYLLANGVIVPPCKVGYYIWFIKNDKLTFGQVEDVTISRNGTYAFVFEVDEEDDIIDEWTVPLCDFGKTVFLTKEEAENALSKLQASYKQIRKEDEGK